MMVACPLCDSRALETFLARDGVPVHQNVPEETAEAARKAPRGRLELACCANCGFVTNVAFDASLLRYGEGYENDQSFSSLFDAHMAAMAARLIDANAVRGKRVVEVGCGQGGFLQRVCDAGGNTGFGFDEAYRGPSRVRDVEFSQELFGARQAHLRADFVVCRHVIEHVSQPLQLLRAVKDGLGSSPGARIFFETPDVSWILNGVVIQDFFYEHCSYFTPTSLSFAFSKTGFEVTRASRVFGDQYQWLEGVHRGAAVPPPAVPNGEATLVASRAFARGERERFDRINERLSVLRKKGPVAVWGAGAKGVTYLNLLDPRCERVDCVIDINPRKQGRFLPGCGHPIVAPSALAARGVASVIVMNPNYLSEIAVEARRHAPQIEVLPDGEP